MIRLIIFDFDGVIVDSEPLHFEKFAEVLGEEGIEFTWDEYRAKYLAFNDVDCFSHILEDRGAPFDDARLADLAARKAAKFGRDMKTRLKTVPGTPEFIRRAAPRHRLAIASGALRHEVEDVLDWNGLREFFPVIVGAEDSSRGKPAPDPFLLALERTNQLIGPTSPIPFPPEREREVYVPPPSPGERVSGRGLEPLITPSECLVIEDSPLGIQGAIDAGMHTLALTTSYTRERISHAEHVSDTLTKVGTPVGLPLAVLG